MQSKQYDSNNKVSIQKPDEVPDLDQRTSKDFSKDQIDDVAAQNSQTEVSKQQVPQVVQSTQFNQNQSEIKNIASIQGKFENPFKADHEIAQAPFQSELSSKMADNANSKTDQVVEEYLNDDQQYSSIFTQKHDINDADDAQYKVIIQKDDLANSQVKQITQKDEGQQKTEDILVREIVIEIQSDSKHRASNKDTLQDTETSKDTKPHQNDFNGSKLADSSLQNTINESQQLKMSDAQIQSVADKSKNVPNIDSQIEVQESIDSIILHPEPSPINQPALDTINPHKRKNSIKNNVGKIFKVEKTIGDTTCDVNQLRRKHIKELRRKKKLQAKDDFGRVEVRKSMEDQLKHRDKLLDDNLSDLLRGHIGNDSQLKNQQSKIQKVANREKNPSRVRKMSETPPKRNRQNQLKNNLISDEEFEELEVNHSLQVLQANLRFQQVGSTPRKQTAPDFLKSSYDRNRKSNDLWNLNTLSRFGQDSQNLILNPKDSIFRKLSNYGSNGYDNMDGQSVTDVIERPDITKAQKGNPQSEKDDGEDDDGNDLVSLQDKSLDFAPSFICTSAVSMTQLEKNIQKAIDRAENMTANQLESQPLLPEDYESLVFGQSIWSTEVQKESKKQFLSNLQQMQSSDKHNENSSEMKSKQLKEHHESDPENEFDFLHKKIQQETSASNQNFVQQDQPQKPIGSTTNSEHKQLNNQIETQQVSKSQFAPVANTQPAIVNQTNLQYQTTQLSTQNSGQQQQNSGQNNSVPQFQDNQQNIYHSTQQFNSNQPQHNQYEIQGTTGAQPVGEMSQGAQFQQDPGDYGGQYQQQPQQDFTSASGVGVNNPSVHSGQVQFGAPAGSGSAVGIFEVGPDYAGDQSSNYCPSTHHPFSIIGDPHHHTNQHHHPALQGNNFAHNNQQQNHQQNQVQNQHKYGNQNNAYYIMIKRQMNRQMMGPIFKSKNHGPVMMPRFSGVPWRGGHHIPALIMAPHQSSGFMDNMEHMQIPQQQHMPPQNFGIPNNVQMGQITPHNSQFANQTLGQIDNKGTELSQQISPTDLQLMGTQGTNHDIKGQNQPPIQMQTQQQHIQSMSQLQKNNGSTMAYHMQASIQESMYQSKDGLQVTQSIQEINQVQPQTPSLNQVSNQTPVEATFQEFTSQTQMLSNNQSSQPDQFKQMLEIVDQNTGATNSRAKQDQQLQAQKKTFDQHNDDQFIKDYQTQQLQTAQQLGQSNLKVQTEYGLLQQQNEMSKQQDLTKNIDLKNQNGLYGMQSALGAEPFYPSKINEQNKNTETSMQYPLQNQNSMMMQNHMQQSTNQNNNPQGKKLGDLINQHQRQQGRTIKQPTFVLPIPVFAEHPNRKPQKPIKHQKHNQNLNGLGEKNQQENINNDFTEYNNGQNDQQYHQKLMTFYDSSIISKKKELDLTLKQTTEKLGQKIIISKAINQDDDEDDQEEDDITFDMLSTHEQEPDQQSVERPESVLNKSMNIKEIKQHLGKVNINLRNLKQEILDNKGAQNDQTNRDSGSMKQEEKIKINQFEDKEKRKNQRAAIFKKLQEQLEQFKNEMFDKSEVTNTTSATVVHNNSSSISPKRSTNLIKEDKQVKDRNQQIDVKPKDSNNIITQTRLTPFRQDPKQYLDKVLDLMHMINEVDDVTNVANMKNKIEKYKLFIIKARTERDFQSRQVIELQHQLQHQTFVNNELKEKEIKYQNQITENSNLIQTLNQNLQNLEKSNEHSCQMLNIKQQVEQQLCQEKERLLHEKFEIQKNLEELSQMHQHQLNTARQENEQLQGSIQFQQTHIQQLQSQIEQLNQKHYQVQQNLNQQQLDNQMIQSKLDKMEGDRIILENKLKDYQTSIINPQANDDAPQLAGEINETTGNNTRSQSRKQLDRKIDIDARQDDRSISNNNKKTKDVDNYLDNRSEDSNEIPLETQLENANQQIKDLQEYIKKRRLNDHQNKQSSTLPLQSNELKQLNEKYNNLKKQFEEMEREKDKIIMRLKDFIKNHNESILIGSLGSSMVGTGNIVYTSNMGCDTRSERGMTQSNQPCIQSTVDDQSTIEARSQIDNSIDNFENEDIVRAIMNDYTCEKCDEKEQIIQNNEKRIIDLTDLIKKRSMQRFNSQLSQSKDNSNKEIQSQIDQLVKTDMKLNKTKMASISTQTQPQDNSQKPSTATQSVSKSEILNNNSNCSSGGAGNLRDCTGNVSNSSLLKSSHQILLNNYIRQVKVYLDNVEEQDSEQIEKMKGRLDQVASQQRITLFDEDDGPDTDLITPQLIQQVIQLSMDLINDLLQVQKSMSAESVLLEQQQPQVIEKIVEKVQVQFKTIEFGISPTELKDMQKVAREERKACHQIIVQIEALIYEMNTLMSLPAEQFNHSNAQKVFQQIMDTYLLLPHRLKPIFDHCKKIEQVMQKAMKSQDDAIKKAQKELAQQQVQPQTSQIGS